jgi:CDP-paratose 2-epimerase
MKLLITGVCGFVGSVLAEHWLASERGVKIHGIDNLSRAGSEQNRVRLQKLGIQVQHGDIRMASDFDTIPAVDFVIDAAANPSVLAGVEGLSSSRQLVEHNLAGTINLLEFCKRHGAGLILLSTSRVYSIRCLAHLEMEVAGAAFRPRRAQAFPAGVQVTGIGEACSTAAPISLYGSTKLASEQLALEYGDAFGFPVWINRCGVLAGAGQFGRADQGIFSFWIHAWLARYPLRYIGFGGEGHQVRDCFHPRDLVPLLCRQMSASDASKPKIVNLGGGDSRAMSLAELSCWCGDRFFPGSITGCAETRLYDLPWVVMDGTLASQAWNWQPTTSLEEILSEIAGHAERNPNWLEFSGVL